MLFQPNSPSFDVATAIPMFALWIAISILAAYLIIKKRLSTKTSLILYATTVIIGGVVLGGVPNAVMPIQQILMNIAPGSPIAAIVPMIIILTLLLLSTLVVGRIFCGYACPIGAAQELISKINFKSSNKEQKKVKYKVDISRKTASIIRWSFFSIIVVLSIFWSLSLLQSINPFLGLNMFRVPNLMAILIPIITLIAVLIASIFVYRPWCRFLCPFGALSGLTSRYSRYKYHRTDACTECGLCENICPTQEANKDSRKGECYYCNRCVEECPVNAIEFNDKK